MFCPRCARCNRPEELRCACGHVLPLARSLRASFWEPDECEPDLRAPRTRQVLIGAVLGGALGFVGMLLMLPVFVFVSLFLTCGLALSINWDQALPWLLLLGVGTGASFGCLRAVRE
jgi:hypothetical protein